LVAGVEPTSTRRLSNADTNRETAMWSARQDRCSPLCWSRGVRALAARTGSRRSLPALLGTVYPERRARWLISQSPDDSPYNSTEVPSNIPTSRRSTSPAVAVSAEDAVAIAAGFDWSTWRRPRAARSLAPTLVPANSCWTWRQLALHTRTCL